MKITLPFLILFISTIGMAQTRRHIQGKIVVRDASPADVLILNLNTEQEARSNALGLFTILAKTEDVLVFSSVNLDYMRKMIEENDVHQGNFEIKMTSKQIVLDEVEIKTYNAVNLGIRQKAAIQYTPAERRLKTAGDFKPIHLLGLLGGSLELDPIFNAINGKTKRLKKEIKLERNKKRLMQFQEFFPKHELMEQVKIDRDQVMEFTYYVLEKDEFIAILEKQEKSRMLFYLIEMHSQFKNQNTIE
jgi:hypothetical protein